MDPTDIEREIELEARREDVEHLRLEARRDAVKDVEREQKIEALESKGDLVDRAAKAPAIKKGAFGHADWNIQDKVTIAPAKLQKSWYTKSQAAQARELQKICGTWRPPRGGRKLTVRDVVDFARPGTLKDHHESKIVRRRTTEADAILDSHPIPKIPVAPAPAPEPVMGYCQSCHKALPRFGIRADTKFCQDNNGKCRADHNRREANREKLGAIFKDYQPKVVPDSRFYYPPPAPEMTPPMTASHAIRSNQVANFLLPRKAA
jgi:hypothetical protein